MPCPPAPGNRPENREGIQRHAKLINFAGLTQIALDYGSCSFPLRLARQVRPYRFRAAFRAARLCLRPGEYRDAFRLAAAGENLAVHGAGPQRRHGIQPLGRPRYRRPQSPHGRSRDSRRQDHPAGGASVRRRQRRTLRGRGRLDQSPGPVAFARGARRAARLQPHQTFHGMEPTSP